MYANGATIEAYRESEVLSLGPGDNPLAGFKKKILSTELHGGADHQ